MGTIARSRHHGLEGIAQGKILEHVGKAWTTRRQLIFREMLNVEMANRNGRPKRCRQSPKNSVNPNARRRCGMNGTDQHDQAHKDDPKALRNTEGTRLKPFLKLEVERGRHQTDRCKKTE